MSQYGAQGMAKEGYDYKAIVQHYYQGVKIEKRQHKDFYYGHNSFEVK